VRLDRRKEETMHPLYRKLTWPEVVESVQAQRVVLVPIGAIEQHGYHLPIDMDNLAVETVCVRAAEQCPDLLVCAPPIHYGFNEHNMDFPGTISVEMEHFIHYCFDVASSFAHQGFERILLVNGHGSNAHLLDSVARLVNVRSSAKCASLSYWDLTREAFDAVRESPYPGGVNHACEYETSIYLYLEPDGVQMDLAVRDLRVHTKYFYEDLLGGSPIRFTGWRSAQTKSGVGGDPTLATAEKGELIVAAAAQGLIEVALDFKEFPFGERENLLRTIPTANRANGVRE
jgi:creatinine amidohydrolase